MRNRKTKREKTWSDSLLASATKTDDSLFFAPHKNTYCFCIYRTQSQVNKTHVKNSLSLVYVLMTSKIGKKILACLVHLTTSQCV